MTLEFPFPVTTALATLAAILTVTPLNAGSPNGPMSIRPDACEQDDGEGGDAGEDGDQGCLPLMNSAPAGTVAPPANGLFGNDAPPKAQVNEPLTGDSI